MASISFNYNSPVKIALNKDPDDLTEEDKQLLIDYNSRCEERKKHLSNRKAEIEERNMNIQLDVLRQCFENADDAIKLASKDLNDKKYLAYIDERINSLLRQRKKDFPMEAYYTIDDKIKQLKTLYASIDT